MPDQCPELKQAHEYFHSDVFLKHSPQCRQWIRAFPPWRRYHFLPPPSGRKSESKTLDLRRLSPRQAMWTARQKAQELAGVFGGPFDVKLLARADSRRVELDEKKRPFVDEKKDVSDGLDAADRARDDQARDTAERAREERLWLAHMTDRSRSLPGSPLRINSWQENPVSGEIEVWVTWLSNSGLVSNSHFTELTAVFAVGEEWSSADLHLIDNFCPSELFLNPLELHLSTFRPDSGAPTPLSRTAAASSLDSSSAPFDRSSAPRRGLPGSAEEERPRRSRRSLIFPVVHPVTTPVLLDEEKDDEQEGEEDEEDDNQEQDGGGTDDDMPSLGSPSEHRSAEQQEEEVSEEDEGEGDEGDETE